MPSQTPVPWNHSCQFYDTFHKPDFSRMLSLAPCKENYPARKRHALVCVSFFNGWRNWHPERFSYLPKVNVDTVSTGQVSAHTCFVASSFLPLPSTSPVPLNSLRDFLPEPSLSAVCYTWLTWFMAPMILLMPLATQRKPLVPALCQYPSHLCFNTHSNYKHHLLIFKILSINLWKEFRRLNRS